MCCHDFPSADNTFPVLLRVYTTFTNLDVRELTQVCVHGDESVINQLLVVISPQHVAVLDHRAAQAEPTQLKHCV